MSLHFFPSLLRITNGRLDYYWQQSEDQRVAISIADAHEFSTRQRLTRKAAPSDSWQATPWSDPLIYKEPWRGAKCEAPLKFFCAHAVAAALLVRDNKKAQSYRPTLPRARSDCAFSRRLYSSVTGKSVRARIQSSACLSRTDTIVTRAYPNPATTDSVG